MWAMPPRNAVCKCLRAWPPSSSPSPLPFSLCVCVWKDVAVCVCVCIIRKPKVIILSNWWICLFPRQSSDYSHRATPPHSPRRRSCSYHACRDSKRKPMGGGGERGLGMCYMANASQTNGRRFVRGSLWIVDDSPPYITPTSPFPSYPWQTIVRCP